MEPDQFKPHGWSLRLKWPSLKRRGTIQVRYSSDTDDTGIQRGVSPHKICKHVQITPEEDDASPHAGRSAEWCPGDRCCAAVHDQVQRDKRPIPDAHRLLSDLKK